MKDGNVSYSVRGLVDQAEVPSWSRRPPKWSELIALIEDLKPGDTVLIDFPNKDEANRARNVVRDELNARIGRAAIRTRLVKNEEDEQGASVYFSRLHPLDIKEAE